MRVRQKLEEQSLRSAPLEDIRFMPATISRSKEIQRNAVYVLNEMVGEVMAVLCVLGGLLITICAGLATSTLVPSRKATM